MKSLASIVNNYLTVRRSLGFDLGKHEPVLRQFVRFFTAKRATFLTTQLALEWAKAPRNADPAWWTDRLCILRGFAKFWRTVDARTEIPPVGLLLPNYKRPAPYIYSDQEITSILSASRDLPSADRLTYWTLFGLLIITGARIGELLAMTDEDVAVETATLSIHDGKRGKARILPLHGNRSRKNFLIIGIIRLRQPRKGVIE